jgi:hypothetical protein
MEDDHPVTRQEFDTGLATHDERLMEFMRQVETNLLTAFHSYAKGQYARLHTMETIDQELRIRMETLEDRVLSLETRPRL